MGMSEEKIGLRTQYRLERSERYLKHSFEHLADTSEFQKAKIIASYISYADEPDTSALNLALINNGKLLLLPRIIGSELEWVLWTGEQNQISTLKKISEPLGNAYDDLKNVDLIIVPALRIDRSGYRLGQGGGYYDRALPNFSAFSIGLIHSDELSSEDLPRDDWDIPLSAAATPDLVVRFQK